MLKQQQARVVLLQKKLGKLLSYAAELELLIGHPNECKQVMPQATGMKWHLYFEGLQF